jgi:ABC-2 type transport system ATP-binding protein
MKCEFAVEAKGLDKKYKDIHAVKGINFTIRNGEIFSLLGPNGAGKTTTISMLSTLLTPTKGDALVMGHSVVKEPMAVKKVLGVVPQEVALYEDLTARENLAFWGKMYGLRGLELKKRISEVLKIISLEERQKGMVGKFSGGMKRRVNIGVALLHQPELIIMDEPTVGIDPQSRRNILDSVKELNRRGCTVLYTTHYMEEAQELSDHVAIMDHGEIIASGTHAELVKIVGELDRIDLTLNAPVDGKLKDLVKVKGVKKVTSKDGTLTLLVDDSDTVLPRLFELTARLGLRIATVEIKEPNLETVFLQLTGRALRDNV